MSELKPCPFCGQEVPNPVAIEAVTCYGCGIGTTIDLNARERWNTRAGDIPTDKDALQAMLDAALVHYADVQKSREALIRETWRAAGRRFGWLTKIIVSGHGDVSEDEPPDLVEWMSTNSLRGGGAR